MCNNLLLIFMRGRKLITTRFIMVRSCHEKVFKKFQESLLLCNSVQSKIVKKHTFTRAHLQNKRFALKFKFQRNASKFPIFI